MKVMTKIYITAAVLPLQTLTVRIRHLFFTSFSWPGRAGHPPKPEPQRKNCFLMPTKRALMERRQLAGPVCSPQNM